MTTPELSPEHRAQLLDLLARIEAGEVRVAPSGRVDRERWRWSTPCGWGMETWAEQGSFCLLSSVCPPGQVEWTNPGIPDWEPSGNHWRTQWVRNQTPNPFAWPREEGIFDPGQEAMFAGLYALHITYPDQP